MAKEITISVRVDEGETVEEWSWKWTQTTWEAHYSVTFQNVTNSQQIPKADRMCLSTVLEDIQAMVLGIGG